MNPEELKGLPVSNFIFLYFLHRLRSSRPEGNCVIESFNVTWHFVAFYINVDNANAALQAHSEMPDEGDNVTFGLSKSHMTSKECLNYHSMKGICDGTALSTKLSDLLYEQN